MAEIAWTPLLIEERMAEAADTLRRLPDTRIQGFFSTWPATLRDYWESYGLEEVRVRRGPPSHAAVSRMDESLVWLTWLDPADARIVWMRAAGEPWKAVCWRVGLARSAAHQHWMYGICVIAWRLNGRRIPRNVSRRQVIEQSRAAGMQ